MGSTKLSAQEMSQTNKDMDFATLKDKVETAIYNQMRIPLPLVKTEQMTLANMEVAKLSLYDNAVLPTTKRLMSELSRFLLHRFERDDKRFRITFDEGELPALQIRRNEQIKILHGLHVLTDNQILTEICLPTYKGGDVIYKPTNLYPLAAFEEKPNALKSIGDVGVNLWDVYYKKMSSIKGPNGRRVYTDSEIKSYFERSSNAY
jgi:hypothetical protein